MLLIPFSDNPRTYKLFIVLEDDNVERVRTYDPVQVQTPIPGYENKRLEIVFVSYANLEDREFILRNVKEGKIQEVLEYLSRGFKFSPSLGDYDGPPISLLDKGETKH
jgi:hypothetical protein